MYTDCRFGKIYNWQITAVLLAGLLFKGSDTGAGGIFAGGLSIAVIFLMTFPLFAIGTLGGGDIKLLAAAAVFMTPVQALFFLVIAFFFGAAAALFKMLRERNFIERFRYLMSYVHDVLTTNTWKLYEDNKQQTQEEMRTHKVHLALPVFLSALLYMGGVY